MPPDLCDSPGDRPRAGVEGRGTHVSVGPDRSRCDLRYRREMMTTTLLDRACALASTLTSYRASHDAARQLDPAVIAKLREADVLGALVPRELGGHELSPADYVVMLEALALGDSATAWCVMTASTSTLLAAYLPRDTATALWRSGAPAPFLAGIFAPTGTLTVDGGGERARLTGRWSWASGSRHAEHFVVGALRDKRHVVCFVPPAAVRVVDNWDTLGLAGTGSHDLVIDDVEVPLDHVTSVFDRPPWTAGALYRVPLFGLLAAGIAGCALGVARGALDTIARPLTTDAPSSVLARYAELRAGLDAARAYLLAVMTTAHAQGAAGPVDAATRGELRLAASHAVTVCVDVVRACYHLGGGAAVRAGHPLQYALRDIETMSTHRMVVDKVLPATARAMLGLGAVPPDL